jgi:NTE family protein
MIRNLIFEGGGVRGIAYLGALKVLDEKNILENVEQVGGSSAGAITAFLIGLGYSFEEIKRIILEEVKVSEFRDGGGLFSKKSFISQKGLYKGDKFYQWAQDTVAKKLGQPKATFNDLRLKLIEQQSQSECAHHPYRFRNIAFIGSNISTGYYEIFSCETSEAMPIADAVRISMSYPFFFAPFQASENGHDPQGHYYVDGGLLKNYPIDLFDKSSLEPNLETLGFRIDLPEEIEVLSRKKQPTAHPIHDFVGFVHALVSTAINGETNQHKRSLDDSRTVYINTQDVQTMDLDIDKKPEKIALLIKEGEKATRDYFKQPRLANNHPLHQLQENRHRLEKYDRMKLYEKAEGVYVSSEASSPAYIQWVFASQHNPLAQRQKVKKYAERLYGQEHAQTVAYAETADFGENKNYVVTLVTDDPKASKQAKKYQGKYAFKLFSHMVETSTIVSLGFWRKEDHLLSYKDTLPQLLFEAVGDAEKATNLRLLAGLIKQGVRTDYRDQQGRSPLHQAARHNHLEAMRLLLAGQADIRAEDNYAYAFYQSSK